MMPRATYRLQFNRDFTFADGAAIVPYLADLGISHIYASPITMARAGSSHGYDVIDPRRISPELGGEDGLRRMVEALHARGMGLIIDIVPNHMGVAGTDNPYWRDVLTHGKSSRHAALFDIDWQQPIALPVLEAPLDGVIAQGDLRLVEGDDGPGLQLCGGTIYPVAPGEALDASTSDHHVLRAIAERQAYRLLPVRAANDELNWRRFFSVNDLAGVRVEDEAVLAFTHELFFDLFAQGLIDGVRVDHIDGLADPTTYCQRLRAGLDAAGKGRHAYIVVEKILARDEALPPQWPVDGTSGYDFMREVSGVLHDPAGMAPLAALWSRISGRPGDFASEALAGRRDVLAWQFEGQLEACLDSFLALAQATGHQEVTRGMLRRATEGLLQVFPVYRTYGTGRDALPGDRPWREAARAAMTIPPGEEAVTDMILSWLAGEEDGDDILRAQAVRRFQQLSAPIAAKGVEDTAFYRYGVLLSTNEVGFDPAHPALSNPAFHAAMVARARDWPHAMLATGTHDHKRGEEARARLSVLSSIPQIWEETVTRWQDLAAPHAQGIDPGDVYMLFQMLVGAWQQGDETLSQRLRDTQRKALREARLRSSWEAPDEAYEQRCADLTDALLTMQGFQGDFTRFMADLAPAALAAGLSQTALHYLAPGVPDLYQGCELPDTSMVDPDNRRPVDFTQRQAMLGRPGSDAKLDLIGHLLALRQTSSTLRDGDYQALTVTGPRADHVLTFVRQSGAERLCCAVAVRMGAFLFGTEQPFMPLAWWQDTMIHDEDHQWLAADLFARGGVAVLRQVHDGDGWVTAS